MSKQIPLHDTLDGDRLGRSRALRRLGLDPQQLVDEKERNKHKQQDEEKQREVA